MKRDGDLHRGESRRLPVVVREDVHRLAGMVAAARCWRRALAVLCSGDLVDAAVADQAPARCAVVVYIAWYSSTRQGTLGTAAVPDPETTAMTRSRMWL